VGGGCEAAVLCDRGELRLLGKKYPATLSYIVNLGPISESLGQYVCALELRRGSATVSSTIVVSTYLDD